MLEPVPASTVVVCRITTKWPHKILLIKRSERATFLPGAYVFPGGRIEEQDHAFAKILARDTTNSSRVRSSFDDDDNYLTYVAAAIRETLEETGVSLIKTLDAPTLLNVISNANESNHHITFSSLWPISWWITPHGETRRFDTKFFLALIDDERSLATHQPINDEGICDLRWLSPAEALLAYAEQEIFLAPPTRSILERMVATTSLDDFLRYVDTPLRAIRPHFIEEDGNKTLVLPGDMAHSEPERPLMLLHTRYKFP